MNGMRKVVFIVTAMVLAVFALPASAQVDKSYTFTMANSDQTTPATIAGGATTNLYALFRNSGPPSSNSSFNSVQVIGALGFKITSATPDNGQAAVACTGSGVSTQCTVSVTKSNPQLVSSPTFKVKMSVQSLLTETTCAGTGTLWNSTASTGSGNNKFNFAYSTAETNAMRTVTDTASCSIAFVNQPKKAFTGYAITTTAFNNPPGDSIQVQLLINGSPPATGTQVDLSSACVISQISATTNGSGIATFDTVSVSPAASGCTLKASWSGLNTTSGAFDVRDPDGTLASCGGTATGSNADLLDSLANGTTPPSNGQQGFALVRGKDTNGSCPTTPIPYTFSCDPDTSTCVFTEDSLGQHPSVEYIVLWPLVARADDPFADKQACVSWGFTTPVVGDDPNVCGGDYVPGLACVTNNADIGDAAMPPIPDVAPFHGNSHYVPGQKAKVCIAQHAFTAGTDDGNGHDATGSLVYWTWVIDQSDTGIRLP